MVNRWVGIGRVVDEKVELRRVNGDVPVGRFTLAVDRPLRNGGSEKGKEREADFIDVTVWRRLAETCSAHLSRGRLVAVEGRLRIRSYEDQNGVKRKAAEIVADSVSFLDRKRDSAAAPDGGIPSHLAATGAALDDLMDDDLPF